MPSTQTHIVKHPSSIERRGSQSELKDIFENEVPNMAATLMRQPSHSTTLPLLSPSLRRHEIKPPQGLPHNHLRPNEEDLGKEQLLPSTKGTSNSESKSPTPGQAQQHQKYLYLYNEDVQRKETIARLTRDLKKANSKPKS